MAGQSGRSDSASNQFVTHLDSAVPEEDTEDTYWNSFLPAFFDRMSMQMRRNMTKIVEPYGLTSAHAVYLIALNLQNGQTLVSLSKFLDMDTANTNRVIKILREKGFVYDDRKSESSKKYSIYLTESGQHLARLIMVEVKTLNNSYFANIPKEDILRMRNTLIKVLNNMNVDIDSYMGSKYEDPFYTHLHITPLDEDYPTESLRAPQETRSPSDSSS
ncbi:MAG: winged helix-turn-helix transcriptional regulator [Candidatus Methanomethylophilaceae archaeon]|nr:winged helix-turn-helix transcriptional regulator [Candidatus Methanomethylophilaceae archaeon]